MGIEGVVAGWGRKDNKENTRMLREGKFKIWNDYWKRCAKKIDGELFCSTGLKARTKPGDSGGPFMVKERQR